MMGHTRTTSKHTVLPLVTSIWGLLRTSSRQRTLPTGVWRPPGRLYCTVLAASKGQHCLASCRHRRNRPIQNYKVYNLLGHSTRVKCICISPNERYYVSSSAKVCFCRVAPPSSTCFFFKLQSYGGVLNAKVGHRQACVIPHHRRAWRLQRVGGRVGARKGGPVTEGMFCPTKTAWFRDSNG